MRQSLKFDSYEKIHLPFDLLSDSTNPDRRQFCQCTASYCYPFDRACASACQRPHVHQRILEMESSISKIHLGYSFKSKVTSASRISCPNLIYEKMKKATSILKHTMNLLAEDVQSFRKIVLTSGGGDLPKEIKEKQKLIHEIESWLKTTSGRAAV